MLTLQENIVHGLGHSVGTATHTVLRFLGMLSNIALQIGFTDVGRKKIADFIKQLKRMNKVFF